MFMTLVKSRMGAIFASAFRSSTKKKRGPAFAVLMGILVIYVIAVFFLMFGAMFTALCEGLCSIGLDWLYFSLAGMMSFLLCFIGSVFFVKTQMFESTDNELLLSMPIPPGAILGSRVLSILLLNYLYELLVFIPAISIYVWEMGWSTGTVLGFLVVSLFLPLLGMAFSCLAGWVITLITERMPMKNLFTILLFLAFMGVYFYLYSKIPEYANTLASRGEEIAGVVKKAIFPAYYFGLGARGELGAIGIFILCSAAPFLVVYVILSRSFIHIVTTKRGRAKVKYKEKQQKSRPVMGALIWREGTRVFSNAMYLLNAALSSIFLLSGAVLLAVKWNDIEIYLQMIPAEFEGYIHGGIGIILCVMLSMNLISAPSISTEGKNLWLIKSLPVKESSVLFAKVWLHVLFNLIPAYVTATVCVVLLRPSPAHVAMIYLLPAVYSLVSAELGVLINLRFPRLDYVNDVAAVKQSISSIVSMVVSMGIVVLPIIGYIYLLSEIISVYTAQVIYMAVLAAVAVLLTVLLKGWGVERFKRL